MSDEDGERPVLEAWDIGVEIGSTHVLSGVELRVKKGRIVALLGPSGAGKSTLFRVLAGELQAKSGRVSLDGQDVTRLPLWRRARAGFGYVPQTPSVLWELDVAENIRVFAKCAGRRELEIRACASEVSLQGRLHTRASALSGGERRKLELLRALIAEPKILILDEPFAGVDPAAAAELGAILQARARAGMSIVLADHRVREALEICDEAMLLVDGRVELRTDRVTFREHPAVRARYLT